MSKRKTKHHGATTTYKRKDLSSKEQRIITAKEELARGSQSLETIKLVASDYIFQGNFHEAESLLKQAYSLAPNDTDTAIMQAKVFINTGRYQAAINTLELIFRSKLKVPGAHFLAGFSLYNLEQFESALEHTSKALMLNPYEPEYLFQKATILMALSRYSDAAPIFERLIKKDPNKYLYLNNAGNLFRDLGDNERAKDLFKRAMELTNDNSYAYSNYLTTLHYEPGNSQEEIYETCLDWERKFFPTNEHKRPIPKDLSPCKKLRIGMISDGFRNHPVGKMIITPLEKLPPNSYEFFSYSSSGERDHITRRFEKISFFSITSHLKDEELAQKIRDDQIDILFDLSGHNSGTRMRVMAMQPAPLLVKWVGGLINTTGLSTIDYLISDNIETPSGVDSFFPEKLIRMPNDYVCYEVPSYIPEVSELPAVRNGFITLGCFNNPTKINDILLEQWAKLLIDLKGSRLYLKGRQYATKEFCNKIIDSLGKYGIEPSRITIEGPSSHNKLLESYKEVDIALDTWPYSGGLTTCEAFAMGVPVVTLPGPTFAGRHSATHLVNAGMPELVTHSWDEYRARVLELASDLDSLATIRSYLRTVLLQSPVCNADTFAGDLNNALRAIWQRYCEGKQPEALSFNDRGQVTFADSTTPVTLQQPKATINSVADEIFKWEFERKIIAIDHGGQLMDDTLIKQMLDLGTLELITFDPASNNLKNPIQQHHSVHYYPNTLLGNGETATLYACQATQESGTLKPAPNKNMPKAQQQQLTILAELPIGSVSLDKVSELPSIDWLVLDGLNDALSILENGASSLKNTLLIQARLAFQPTHEKQPDFTEISYWAARNGFRFYCFQDNKYRGPVAFTGLKSSSFQNELVSANAIFIPVQSRLSTMSKNQLIKLAFIAESCYGLKGLAYETLSIESFHSANKYLESVEKKSFMTDRTRVAARPRREEAFNNILEDNTGSFIHLCFNNMHVNHLLDMLDDSLATAGYKHYTLIEEHRSIPGYDVNLEERANCIFFNKNKDIDIVEKICKRENVYGIFIHGLFFDWQKEIINHICNDKKVIWVMWGGDLYNPISQGKPLTSTVSKLYAVSTWFDKDYDFFKSNYGNKKRLEFHYLSQQKFTELKIPESKQKTIIIGNSGDPSNNHIEIINEITKAKDIKDFRLVFPIGYNAPSGYAELIRKSINSIDKNIDYEIIEKNLPTMEYFELISKSEFFITAHNRQQASESILAAIYFGCKVFLRFDIKMGNKKIENPVKHKFRNLGIKFFDFNKIDFYLKEGLSEIKFPNGYNLSAIQHKIIGRDEDSEIKKSVKSTFEKLAGYLE